jgi:hypothetical protein
MIARLTAYETGQYLAAAILNLESYGATERQAIFDAAVLYISQAALPAGINMDARSIALATLKSAAATSCNG